LHRLLTEIVEPGFTVSGVAARGHDGAPTKCRCFADFRRSRGWLRAIRGSITGRGHVWPFRSAWSEHLDTQGARDMARLNAFIRSVAWYKLVPSGLEGAGNLITGGGATPESSTYVAAAATPDGTLLVAYIPPGISGSISVDMQAMGGPTRARWFDPTSGAFREIEAGMANTGRHSFALPGPNSAGASDWVLLLESPV